MAENRPSFDLALIPQQVTNAAKTIEACLENCRLDPQVVEAKWNKTKNLPSYFPS